MTKFDSVQISHRKGKQASTYTTAELRKNMAIYKATGVHPELEQRAASSAEAAPGLPASDAERPHVFFELVRITATQLRETVGTLVVEVFEDIVPAAGKAFVLRATGGGAGLGGLVRYENTEIHRVVPGVRIDGGQQSVLNGKTGAVPLEQTAASRGLPHAAGAVSLSAQGPTFTVAVAACPHLDGEQQVVGRVTSGMDVLEKLSEAKVDDDFAPFERVYVGTCGVCGPGGPRGEGAALAAALRAERGGGGEARGGGAAGDQGGDQGTPGSRERRARRGDQAVTGGRVAEGGGEAGREEDEKRGNAGRGARRRSVGRLGRRRVRKRRVSRANSAYLYFRDALAKKRRFPERI
jgi:cyclophilin family peptidyl-prolyl cis-trans isomerase